ncbi:MAG: hypothetical protein ABEJ58_07160 [Halodesulfurarchaeum sp.]
MTGFSTCRLEVPEAGTTVSGNGQMFHTLSIERIRVGFVHTFAG